MFHLFSFNQGSLQEAFIISYEYTGGDMLYLDIMTPHARLNHRENPLYTKGDTHKTQLSSLLLSLIL